jgi:hypothetical protein
MNAERIKTLEQFYADNPTDPFTIYALALEYVSADRAKAENLFMLLLTDFEDYTPTYYQATAFYISTGNETRAIAVAKKGIEKARAAKEMKTAGELLSLLETIDDDL